MAMMADATGSASTGLNLETLSQKDATVIRCAGRLTSENTTAMKTYVKDAMPHARRIILDLKEVSRMDSAGLGAIVGLYVSARKAKCEFALMNYNNSIKELLGITNLLSIFEDCAHSGMRIP